MLHSGFRQEEAPGQSPPGVCTGILSLLENALECLQLMGGQTALDAWPRAPGLWDAGSLHLLKVGLLLGDSSSTAAEGAFLHPILEMGDALVRPSV